MALLSDALHYRQEVAAGAPRASAAAVYGYERLLYAHPSVTAVVAGDAALLPSFRALQVRAAERDATPARRLRLLPHGRGL